MPGKKHSKIVLNKKDQKEFEQWLQLIGMRVKEARSEKDITQEGMNNSPYPIDERNLRRIEKGNSNVTAKTLFVICKKLGLEPGTLLTWKK